QGNKSFVAFSNLSDVDALTKTWKVCTKVASYLEQGQRLENLSWRLWHLQNLMVDTDNAKSKREFKKLSKNMGDRLDRDKGRNISELSAPDFRPSHSTDLIRQRAVERERNREEAAQELTAGGTRTMKRMQFTFSVNEGGNGGGQPMHVDKPDFKPSAELSVRAGPRTAHLKSHDHMDVAVSSDDAQPTLTQRGRKNDSSSNNDTTTIRFPPLFSSDFGPAALLYPSPTLTTHMNYGEDFTTRPYEHEPNDSQSNQSYSPFSIARPTIELPLDELLHSFNANNTDHDQNGVNDGESSVDVDVDSADDSDSDESSESVDLPYSRPSSSTSTRPSASARQTPRASARATPRVTTTTRPSLTVRTSTSLSAVSTRSSLPSATAPPTPPPSTSTTTTTTTTTTSTPGAPAGQKAECHNCGATHTPLWRRGLNDELNCNACGLYCKLHKRPRPKTMRNQHGGEGGRGANGGSGAGAAAGGGRETVEVMGKLHSLGRRLTQCYNCHTTATPLWRKDDEGKTVCNACGLYYKLHGSARPISMKSDVIRKRSRHDAHAAMQARRGSLSGAASGNGYAYGVASSSHSHSTHSVPSPTFAPDSSTAADHEESHNAENQNSHSENDNGNVNTQNNDNDGDDVTGSMYQNMFSFPFPGPYHPDHLSQYTVYFDSIGGMSSGSPPSSPRRINKRRRMSSDSASEPPSSAISSLSSSYSSSQYDVGGGADGGYSSSRNANSTPNSSWHPPMLLQEHHNHRGVHPPMLLPSTTSMNMNKDSSMDYLHPPMMLTDEVDEATLFSTYLHPPMSLPDDPAANGNSSRSPNARDSTRNSKGAQESSLIAEGASAKGILDGKVVKAEGSDPSSGDSCNNNNNNNNHYYGMDMRIY
ncbi:hypothetical protein GGU10DRAFT_275361, partial [Lentinula aff. detonsa]